MQTKETPGSIELDRILNERLGVRQLAAMVDVSAAYLSMIRKGIRRPSFDLIMRLFHEAGIAPELWELKR